MSVLAATLVLTCDAEPRPDGTVAGDTPGAGWCGVALHVPVTSVNLAYGVMSALVRVHGEVSALGWRWLDSESDEEYLVLCPQHASIPVDDRFQR